MVIGVVANAKLDDWTSDPDPEMYLAALQTPDFMGTRGDNIGAHMTYITVVVRSDGNASDLASRRPANRLVVRPKSAHLASAHHGSGCS